MLSEILKVKQEPGEPFCRWFSDNYFDLFVWYNKDKSIYGFQLCYDKNGAEKAITWNAESNQFSHMQVDSGESSARLKQTPILLPDGEFRKNEVLELLKNNSAKLDEKLFAFIYNELLKY